MVDNFDIIRPLLKWDSSDDFYFIQLLQRKKDHKTIKVNGTNNNARLVKYYCLKNIEQLDFIKPEIIEISKLFNARASINLNIRKFSRVHIELMKTLLAQLENGTQNKGYKAYSKVCGQVNHDKNKKWIVDIDEHEMGHLNYIKNSIEACPSGSDTNIIAEIPSKSGVHLITVPFDRAHFEELLRIGVIGHLDIQTNNPTNLYIP